MKRILCVLYILISVRAVSQQLVSATNVNLVTSPNTKLVISGGIAFTGTTLWNDSGETFINKNTLGGRENWNDATTSGVYSVTSIGKINFSSDSLQYISGLTKFYSLTVNNDSGIVLNNDVEVRNLLNLDKGYVYTGANKMYVSNPSSPSIQSLSGFSSSYIIGILKLATNSSAATYLFPIGKIFNSQYMYAPVKIDKVTNGAAVYTAEYFPSLPANRTTIENPPLDHISDVEYWQIASDQPSGNTNDDAYLTLSWRPYSTVSSNAPTRDSLIIAHYYNPGAGYRWMSEHTIGGTANQGNVNGNSFGTVKSNKIIAGFTAAESNFTIGSMSPYNALPVQIINWDVQLLDKVVRMSWLVNNDRNIDHYEIEKSVDGISFQYLTSVSSLKQLLNINYIALDSHPAKGWNFYRLKPIDDFGRFTYTGTRKVFLGENINWNIYPTPATKLITVAVNNNIPDEKEIFIFDVSGKFISSRTTSSNLININISSLPAGTYVVKVTGKQFYGSKTIVKEP